MWNVPNAITSRIGLILGVGVLLFSSLGCSVNNTAPRGKGKGKARPPEAVAKVRELEDEDDVFEVDPCEDGCEDAEIVEGEACEFLDGVFIEDNPCGECTDTFVCDACGGGEIISEPITEAIIGTPTVCEGPVLDGKCVILSGGELTVMLDERISILGEDSAVQYYDESQIVREYIGDPQILDDEAMGEYITEGGFFADGGVVTDAVIINTGSPASVVTKYAAAPAEKTPAKTAAKPAANSDRKPAETPAQVKRHRVPFQSVVDGETISVLWLNEETRVRLAGVQTPAADSPAAKKATELLRKLIGDREVVELEFPKGEVRYDAQGRLVATVWVRGVNLSDEVGQSARAK